MKLPGEVGSALPLAWHGEVARNSMERWLTLCRREGWTDTPRDLSLLTRVFGASWYFTRFMFVDGREAAVIIDADPPSGVSTRSYLDVLLQALECPGREEALERLRLYKNRLMLQILAASLRGALDQEGVEYALSCLAEATLAAVARLHELAGEHDGHPVTVLGMGRMAGYEMTFGSDLDIIFLYHGSGSDLDPEVERRIRLLLRNIALPTSLGVLYEVDMRLRPHGNAGVLVTSVGTFLDYHGGDRAVWERQMMTRCRPVLDPGGAGQTLLDEVHSRIYTGYDAAHLREEIAAMRKRVQKELGSPGGKFEIKRGRGGIMDIDFISHYLQLAHGYDQEDLRSASTRRVLRQAARLGLLDNGDAETLLAAYDFLKQLEMSLRLFDMKSVSAFPSDPHANAALAIAMGHAGDEEGFVRQYRAVTAGVREIFNRILRD